MDQNNEQYASKSSQGTLTPPLEAAEKKNDAIIGPPPDAGVRAWNQVLVAHLVIFTTWGYINSFGVFQTYYVQTLLHRSPSDVSWIGSLQVFLLFFIGTVSGRATDAGYFRHTFVVGSTFLLIGMFTTSICKEYWQFVLAQGVCVGIGSGLLFCPTIALLPTYFQRRRALAVGIAASGATTGGMIIPGIFSALLPGKSLCTIGQILYILLVSLTQKQSSVSHGPSAF